MKKQKSLRIKCKEMLSQNTNKQYEGLIGDTDMNNWPAPLKIVHQLIQSMKDFRVCMKCNRLVLKIEYENNKSCNREITREFYKRMYALLF